ncbi:pyrroline-5-carboxylate reductase [candidate division KSB1 bacterium]|nr:pyrroline-5-carboxylate reductase [candidate division KSB1 bacterium]
MSDKSTIAILGAGNLGSAIAHGLVDAGIYEAGNILVTNRRRDLLKPLKHYGFAVRYDNTDAVKETDVMIISVEPQQINGLLQEIKSTLDPARHIIISVVTGVSIKEILAQLDSPVTVIRAMPNTAIAIRQSMTCIASENGDENALEIATKIFNTVGETLVIKEEDMIAATALGACGIAFFLRAIRAASQGGIEIGFHADVALKIAAQTAKGAASLVLSEGKHPEHEIDKVTTPRGVTISGLNQMEHEGFSSAMIKGIVTSAEKASRLYAGKNND